VDKTQGKDLISWIPDEFCVQYLAIRE